MCALLACLWLVLAKADHVQAQITIVEHGPFTAMLEQYARQNQDPDRKIDGYRVQLLATTDRLKLEETQRKFGSDFPEHPTDWSHEPPYYKLRTGAFTDRARATQFSLADQARLSRRLRHGGARHPPCRAGRLSLKPAGEGWLRFRKNLPHACC